MNVTLISVQVDAWGRLTSEGHRVWYANSIVHPLLQRTAERFTFGLGREVVRVAAASAVAEQLAFTYKRSTQDSSLKSEWTGRYHLDLKYFHFSKPPQMTSAAFDFHTSLTFFMLDTCSQSKKTQ